LTFLQKSNLMYDLDGDFTKIQMCLRFGRHISPKSKSVYDLDGEMYDLDERMYDLDGKLECKQINLPKIFLHQSIALKKRRDLVRISKPVTKPRHST